ncbi:MAG: hypothetical protein ACLT1C_09785 [Weissella confusa]
MAEPCIERSTCPFYHAADVGVGLGGTTMTAYTLGNRSDEVTINGISGDKYLAD